MHIRRLELQGFKSFKDKTVIHFDDGITGIVGPNGCGKSNVVDAFFWVMGEQNARHLRGQSMDDLIFSGADKAAPAGFAEVTLILDMPADVSGPNAPAGASSVDSPVSQATKEVSITRKLYRTGESDYFLNKVPCRLKDIQELFMDTGVGARGYSIIQQGQIAKIVQAKPEDRRTMIEEVAGIVKYKARRRESVKKLEGTQQNLLRVTDVLNELDTQKRQMERQADKARKYKEWKEKLQSIELQFNALKWEDHNQRVNSLELEIEELTNQDLALTTTRETVETQISQMRLELAQSSSVVEEFQQRWINAGNDLNNFENDFKYSQKNLENLTSSFAQLEKDSEEERQLVETLAVQAEALEIESATIEEQFHQAESNRLDQEAQALECKRSVEENEQRAETARKRLFQVGSELEKEKSTANFAKLRLTQLEEAVDRLSKDRLEQENFLSSAMGEKEAASLRLMEYRSEGERLRAQEQTFNAQMSEKNKSLQDERKEIARLSSELAQIKTTLKTLQEQKQRHEDSSKGVKAVFQKILPKRQELSPSVRGTLADFIEVDKGMETAAEAALGRSLDLVITQDANHHVILGDCLRAENSGRAAFADVKKLNTRSSDSTSGFDCPARWKSNVAGPLLNFVRLQPKEIEGLASLLPYLLEKVVVTRDSESAQTLSELFPDFIFVTVEGALFRGGWFMEGGDKSSVSGAFVGRNREISELEERLLEISSRMESCQQKVTQLESSISDLAQEKSSLEALLRKKQEEINLLASEEGSLSARLLEAQRALAKLLQESERITSEQEKLLNQERECRVSIFALETERGALEVEVTQSLDRLAEIRLSLEKAQSTLVDARVKAANLTDQKNSLNERTRQNKTSLDQHRTRVESMLDQARRKKIESEETQTRIIELQEKIGKLRPELVEAESNYRAAKERFDIINNEVEERRSAAQSHGSRERAVKEALLEKRLDHQKFTGEREALSQNTFERYGILLAEYTLNPETMEQVQILRDAGENTIKEIQNEVLLLREKIRKLGDVNPSAVEEYESIIERFNLLSSQKSDLEKAMSDLQDTVERINKVSRERFERAFGEVNSHFKRVFPVIFGGGHAHLTLTNPEDLLETGVDITAQPPGKKAQNINLLSGGEKTLTAISLLFSIFLVKPSPFCLLDEVDAPLDDANIGRFNALLREMSKRSQFIIITHNKRTMELNDKLYGVTMEDAGVSKMVSIQLSASA